MLNLVRVKSIYVSKGGSKSTAFFYALYPQAESLMHFRPKLHFVKLRAVGASK
jgi:hypothetical protein